MKAIFLLTILSLSIILPTGAYATTCVQNNNFPIILRETDPVPIEDGGFQISSGECIKLNSIGECLQEGLSNSYCESFSYESIEIMDGNSLGQEQFELPKPDLLYILFIGLGIVIFLIFLRRK